MASSQDIRAWAADNGIELNAKGPIRKDIKAQYAAANPGDDRDYAASEDPPGEVVDGEFVTQLETSPAPPKEAPPSGGPKRKFFQRKAKDGTAGPARRGGPRASTETLFSGVWTLASNLLGSTGHAPVARVLQLQAPVAGVLLDRELRGTAADRAIQPLAKMVNKGSTIGALVALPFMVQLASVKPEFFPMLRPHMVEALYRWYEVAGPEMEKQAKRMETRKAQLGGVDPEELLNMIFSVDVPDNMPAE